MLLEEFLLLLFSRTRDAMIIRTAVVVARTCSVGKAEPTKPEVGFEVGFSRVALEGKVGVGFGDCVI